MLISRVIRRLFLSTLMLWVAPRAVVAQPESASVAPPAPSVLMEAYQAVRAWIDRGGGGDGVTMASPGGATVVLRLEGKVLGRGSFIVGDGQDLRRAAELAWSQALERIPIERDALYDEKLRAAIARLTLEVELAGALIPFEPGTYATASAEVAPGLEGVAVRREDVIKARFPGTMLATNTMGGAALASIIAEITGDPTKGLVEPHDLKDEWLKYFRFKTLMIAQTQPGVSPVFLHRGGRVVSQSELNAEGIQALADATAEHLVRRIQDDGTLLGTLHPTTGDYRPRLAGVESRALTALALSMYTDLRGTDAAVARMARERSDRLLATIPTQGGEAEKNLTPEAAALCTIALAGRPRERLAGDVELGRLMLACRPIVEGAFDPESGFATRPGTESAIVLALVRLANLSREPASLHLAEEALSQILLATPADQLVGQMPFLAWASIEHADVAGLDEPRAAAALRQFREDVWARQIAPGTGIGSEQRDLFGGIQFTVSTRPMADWHTARVGAAVATMLGRPELTEADEVGVELGRLLRVLRFLKQLSAGEAECHMFAEPAQSLGGVRSALWDQRMPSAATAMSLLCAVETLRSFERLETAQR